MYKFLILISITFTTFSYYGRYSTEAILNFNSRIELELDNDFTFEDLEDNQEVNDYVLYEIGEQIQYLMGTFSSDSFKNETNGATASISKEYKITFNSKHQGSSQDKMIINYSYEGKILVHRSFFGKNGASRFSEIPIKLPLDVYTVYSLGVRKIKVPYNEDDPSGKKVLKDFNLCADEHYNSEEDFFYFWDPDRVNTSGRLWRYPNCPLANNSDDVVRTTGKLKRIDNSWQTYFEYDRLYNKKELKAFIFLGLMKDVRDYTNVDNEDHIWEGYDYINQKLIDKGFTLVSEFVDQKFSPKKGFYAKGINTLLTYKKTGVPRNEIYKNEGEKFLDIEIKILVSDTAINSKDKTFHHFYRESLVESDILIYDGHSGLGANLDLELIKARLAPKDKYQIFFINGCSGYPYFKDMYFDAKDGGSKNLDLILSGISTITDTIGQNVMGFLDGFLDGKTLTTSYILKNIEDGNIDINGSYLTGVLGEKDNTWTTP